MQLTCNPQLQQLTVLEFQGDFTKYSGHIIMTDDVAKVGNQTIKQQQMTVPLHLYRIDLVNMKVTGKIESIKKFASRPHLDL